MMDEKTIKKAVTALFDRPLLSKEYNLLVDRENELEHLTKICKFQPMGIFGLCGETGIGKTTALNFLDINDTKTLHLVLTEKESKESIIGDLLYKTALAIEKEKEFKKLSEEIKSWVVEERTTTIQAQTEGNLAVISAGVSKGSSINRRFNIYEAQEKISELFGNLKQKFGKIVLLIDELDKEDKKDVLEVLDSLKNAFMKEGLIAIISLPFSIYREYAYDRMRWNESGNLENIFKDMVFLDPLGERDIETMLLKRLNDFPGLFSQDALKVVSRFADGNLRDALWAAQQIILEITDERTITGKSAEKIIRTLVKNYFIYGASLSENKKKILKILSNEQGDKSYLVELLTKNGLKRTTAYMTIDRLTKEGLLIDRRGIIKISGKVYYLI